MSGFLGSYVHQVDEKGRLSLPASFRRGVTDENLVGVQVHPNAITLYPESTWKGVEERLLDMMRRRPESRGYVLGVTAKAVEVSPDKQGRILIPRPTLESVGIAESAMLVGVIDRIEIWDPERFGETVESQQAEFAQFAGQVFA